MTLTARTTNGEIIFALCYDNAASLYKQHPRDTLLSPFPDCNTNVFCRFREGVVPHFVHPSSSVQTGFNYTPYSLDHEVGKLVVGRWMHSVLKEPVYFEYPIGNRIADIVCGPESIRVAAEIQLSPITTDVLEARTYDMFSHGFDVLWALGGKAYTEVNRDWCIQNTGNVYVMEHQTVTTEVGTRHVAELATDFRNAIYSQTRKPRNGS